MKSLLSLITLLFIFSNSIFTQNPQIVFGTESTVKYTFQTQPEVSENYTGRVAFDLGLTVSKPLLRKLIWLHSGLFISKFSDKNQLFLNQPANVDYTNIKRSYHAVQVPVGAKFFFSDRTCYAFFHPAVDFNFYVQSSEKRELINSWGEDITTKNQTSIGDDFSFETALALSLGGQVPIMDKTDVSLQLRSTLGLYGTNKFANGRTFSMGLRIGLLRYFY